MKRMDLYILLAGLAVIYVVCFSGKHDIAVLSPDALIFQQWQQVKVILISINVTLVAILWSVRRLIK